MEMALAPGAGGPGEALETDNVRSVVSNALSICKDRNLKVLRRTKPQAPGFAPYVARRRCKLAVGSSCDAEHLHAANLLSQSFLVGGEGLKGRG